MTISMSAAAHVLAEINSQPVMWQQAIDLAGRSAGVLPTAGQRVAVTGCRTSWFVAQSYAAMRESAEYGVTDAFSASEFPAARRYDLVVAISRSGTTTEVLDLLAALPADKVQFTFLGTGAAVGIAHEAELKMRGGGVGLRRVVSVVRPSARSDLAGRASHAGVVHRHASRRPRRADRRHGCLSPGQHR